MHSSDQSPATCPVPPPPAENHFSGCTPKPARDARPHCPPCRQSLLVTHAFPRPDALAVAPSHHRSRRACRRLELLSRCRQNRPARSEPAEYMPFRSECPDVSPTRQTVLAMNESKL